MKEKMKVVAELAIWDSIAGTVEVLDMKYKDGKLKSLKVRWIVAALCYSGTYIPKEDIYNLYYGEDDVKSEQIYEFKNLQLMSEEKVNALRAVDFVDQTNHTKRVLAA